MLNTFSPENWQYENLTVEFYSVLFLSDLYMKNIGYIYIYIYIYYFFLVEYEGFKIKLKPTGFRKPKINKLDTFNWILSIRITSTSGSFWFKIIVQHYCLLRKNNLDKNQNVKIYKSIKCQWLKLKKNDITKFQDISTKK